MSNSTSSIVLEHTPGSPTISAEAPGEDEGGTNSKTAAVADGVDQDRATSALPPFVNPSIDRPLFTSHAAGRSYETAHQEPACVELPTPRDFRPFFTLVSDPETGEHHHPTVHYLFSDDDPEILTSAALEAIDGGPRPSGGEQEVDERFLVVDMSADGKEVVNVASLSRDWQALRTEVGVPPSMGDDSDGGERGLMLRISGTEAPRSTVRGDTRVEEVEELLRILGEKIGTLDEIFEKIEKAEEGAEVVG